MFSQHHEERCSGGCGGSGKGNKGKSTTTSRPKGGSVKSMPMPGGKSVKWGR